MPSAGPPPVRPPSKHELALMIWLAVFPTLTVLNLALGGWLKTMSAVPRTSVLAPIAVPIVIYGLMPQLHRLRARLLRMQAATGPPDSSIRPRKPSARQGQPAPGENERQP